MASLEELVKQYAAKHGVDPALLYSLVGQESAGKNGRTSSKDAMGLGQIIPETFKEEASKLGIKNPDVWNVNHNLDVAASYLKQQINEFGDTRTALAAYNAGPGAVRKYGGIPPYRETRDYVAKISSTLGESAAKLNSGSATPIIDVRTGTSSPTLPSTSTNASASSTTSLALPPASNYEASVSGQLDTLKNYLGTTESTLQRGNAELRQIDTQRQAQMRELLQRVNYDPMNPNSTGSRNVAELARLSEVQRNTEIAREQTGRAGLFDNPAAFIEKTLFGNPYAQGAKDNKDAIDRLNGATAAVDERIKSQAVMAKDAYLADPAVARAEMESALRVAEIAKDVGIKESEMPLKVEELKLARFRSEVDAMNADTSKKRQELALAQDVKAVEQQQAMDKVMEQYAGDKNAPVIAAAFAKLAESQRSYSKDSAAISMGYDTEAMKTQSAQNTLAYQAAQVGIGKTGVQLENMSTITDTERSQIKAEFYKSGVEESSVKAQFANKDIAEQTEKLMADLKLIETKGAVGRAAAVEELNNAKVITASIQNSNAMTDAQVEKSLKGLQTLIKTSEMQIAATETAEKQVTLGARLTDARDEAAVRRTQVKNQGKAYTAEAEVLDKAVVGAIKLGVTDASAAKLQGWKPADVQALANADANGYAGANAAQSAMIMSTLGVLGKDNAAAPKVGDTWNKLNVSMRSNLPESVASASARDQEAYITTAPQDAFEMAASASSAKGKSVDSSSVLRSSTNVYALPDHDSIIASGALSEDSKAILANADPKAMASGSAVNILEAVREAVPGATNVVFGDAAARRAAAVAFTEYMKAGITVANNSNGYDKLGLPKMSSEHLKMKADGPGSVMFLKGNTVSVDLTDSAEVARLLLGFSGVVMAPPPK